MKKLLLVATALVSLVACNRNNGTDEIAPEPVSPKPKKAYKQRKKSEKSPKNEEKQNVQKLPFTTILFLLKIKIITY